MTDLEAVADRCEAIASEARSALDAVGLGGLAALVMSVTSGGATVGFAPSAATQNAATQPRPKNAATQPRPKEPPKAPLAFQVVQLSDASELKKQLDALADPMDSLNKLIAELDARDSPLLKAAQEANSALDYIEKTSLEQLKGIVEYYPELQLGPRYKHVRTMADRRADYSRQIVRFAGELFKNIQNTPATAKLSEITMKGSPHIVGMIMALTTFPEMSISIHKVVSRVRTHHALTSPPRSVAPPNEPRSSSRPGGKAESVTDSLAEVAIVCALRVPELEKVLATGSPPWRRLPRDVDDPASYHEGAYETLDGRRLRAIAAAPSQMGMAAAAILATKMIRRFRPRLLAVVGIAAGAKKRAQGYGDILAPDITFDYGSGKLEGDKRVHLAPDPRPLAINATLGTRLRDWQVQGPRFAQIQARWPGKKPATRLQLHVGPLGSGAPVVASSKAVGEIALHWRKLIGLEMEAYGVHLASQEAISPAPVFLCLKSVCDFATSRKNDDWQEYAAFTAAQFFEEFLREEWADLFAE